MKVFDLGHPCHNWVTNIWGWESLALRAICGSGREPGEGFQTARVLVPVIDVTDSLA